MREFYLVWARPVVGSGMTFFAGEFESREEAGKLAAALAGGNEDLDVYVMKPVSNLVTISKDTAAMISTRK